MEELDLLMKEELLLIKGGEWCYDPETGEWYWVALNDWDPFPLEKG